MNAPATAEAAPAHAVAERPAAESGERDGTTPTPANEPTPEEAPWPDEDGWVARAPPAVVEAAVPPPRDASAGAPAEAAGVQLDLLREVFPGRVLRFVPHAAAAEDEADAAEDAEDASADERRPIVAPADDRDPVPATDDQDEHPAHGGPR